MTLNNLANLCKAKNEFKEAEQFYQEALAIRRALAKVNPQTYLFDVGITLINQSIYYQKSRPDKVLSIQLVDEAITILWPFRHIPYIQNYLKSAFTVLNNWEIDIGAYMEKMKSH